MPLYVAAPVPVAHIRLLIHIWTVSLGAVVARIVTFIPYVIGFRAITSMGPTVVVNELVVLVVVACEFTLHIRLLIPVTDAVTEDNPVIVHAEEDVTLHTRLFRPETAVPRPEIPVIVHE